MAADGSALEHAQLSPRRDEGLDRSVDIARAMGGGELDADPGFALRYHGIEESDYIDSELEQGFGHPLRCLGIVEHDRHDRVDPGLEVEPRRRHAAAELARVLGEAR